MEAVAQLQHPRYGAGGHVAPGILEHRFVLRGVEGPAPGDAGDAEAAEDIEQLSLDHGDGLDQRALPALFPGDLQGALQVIEDRQETPGERGVCVASLLGDVALERFW